MRPEVYVWLEDIDRAINQIYDLLHDTHNYHEFAGDLKTQKAVERNIEIIGEALSRILKIEPSIHISVSRKTVDTRNRIIHGYDSITPDILWLIIQKSLPVLKHEVDRLVR